MDFSVPMGQASYPFGALIEAIQQKNNNRQQMNKDITGIGQGLGQTGFSIAQIIGEQKKKALMAKLLAQMQSQGQPQLGPQPQGVGNVPPGPGQAGPTLPPTSGMGVPADNTDEMKSLLMRLNPQVATQGLADQLFAPGMNPLQQSQMALEQARTNDLNRRPQQKPTNPITDLLNHKRADYLQWIMNGGKASGKTPPLSPFDRSFITGLSKKVQTGTPFTDTEVEYAKSKFGVNIKNVKSRWFSNSPSSTGLDKLPSDSSGMDNDQMTNFAMQDDPAGLFNDNR